jgi:fatty-acyl-CoA synthase
MNRTEPVSTTLATALGASAALYPSNGFTFQDMAGKDTFYAFPDMVKVTGVRAAAMQKLGLKKGDRAGIIVIEPEDFVLSFFAAVQIGVIPVPLYPPVSMGEFDAYLDRRTRILDTAKADILFASERLQNVLWAVVDRVPTLRKLVAIESLRKCDTEPVFPEITPSDIAFLQYTSGSTADPKGVIVTHSSLHANITGIINTLELDPEANDHALSWLPLYHDMGLIGFVIAPAFWGISSTFIPTLRFLKHPNCWLETASRCGATATFAPPFALGLAARRATPALLEKWNLSKLRIVGVGAEPINPQAAQHFVELLSANCNLPTSAVLPAYGMAEFTLAISLKLAGQTMRVRQVDPEAFENDGVSVDATGEFALEHVSCGPVFPGHEVSIKTPDTGEAVADGNEGEICLRGPSVMPGYYLNEEATAAAFRDGWLRSGDLGYVLDGEIYVTGRLKDLIILNGRNIHPQSIEWPIQNIPGVRKGNVVAFSRPGETTEELVIALERKGDGIDATIEDAVREAISRDFSVSVADIVILDPGLLPKTSSGKLQRNKTRQLYMRGELGTQGSRQAGSSAEKLSMAKHVARSMWTRAKYRVKTR